MPNNHPIYVLKSQVECQVFWVRYIYEIFAPKFKEQMVHQTFHNFDLTSKVMMNAITGELFIHDQQMDFINRIYDTLSWPMQSLFSVKFLNAEVCLTLVTLLIILFAVVTQKAQWMHRF